jgi:hypothetical protein
LLWVPFGPNVGGTEAGLKMRIGFTGTREPNLRPHEEIIITTVLKSLVAEMSYVIVGAYLGMDSFIVHWLDANSDVEQIVLMPSKRESVDLTLYKLPRVTIIDMPLIGNERTHRTDSMRRLHFRIMELSERVVMFFRDTLRIVTRNMIQSAQDSGILDPKDLHLFGRKENARDAPALKKPVSGLKGS